MESLLKRQRASYTLADDCNLSKEVLNLQPQMSIDPAKIWDEVARNVGWCGQAENEKVSTCSQ